MRGDQSWVAGIPETAKMSSILGLPVQGSDVTILITKVHLHPLCVLVEFWGKFSQERTADYEYLAKEIQSPGNTFRETEGNPGDQCLAQVDGTWYRSRIVSRNGSKYDVFLFDKGRTYSTTTSRLAWGKKSHFHLPPEVEFCVLANVLSHSPEHRWSPVALDFLKTLSGKSVKAHVQDVLVEHRTFLLHIPCISKQMYEMGIAKKLSPDVFQEFVLMTLQSQSEAEVSPETQTSMEAGERLQKKELFMYPELPAGTVETVIVTEVTNPQRIFCQLKVFSHELKKLSLQITQCCEGRMTNCIVSPEMIGFPCAARGSDGKWYRSVLQQVCPTSKMVEVLHVDYGTKQFVEVKNVRPLAAEFFRMPIVTYNCSLHGVTDKGFGWTTSQIDYLRTLLLHKMVIARFEYQSISEGVHYVTLYGDENTCINSLFGSKQSCFLDSDKTLDDFAIGSTAHSRKQAALQGGDQRKMITPGQAVEEKGLVDKLPAEELSLNSSHVATVHHVCDPSEFWIQTQNYAKELDELMDNIYYHYKDSVNNDVRNPTLGLYCAAKSKDGDFYRATVVEAGETQVKVFFVDYGNTEVVDRSNIRILPDEFKKLPCLSLKCTLAGVTPKDGKWSRSACELFINTVTDKELKVHVTAKHGESYVVQLTDPGAQGERDVSALMCSSGLAERAETHKQTRAQVISQPAALPPLPDVKLSGGHANQGMSFQTTLNKGRMIPTFKEHRFPIGSVLDVSVSYIESPNDFWCQLVQNAGHLKLLMQDIQAHYAGSEFQPLVETACIARHPDNGMWYRAIVIHKHKTANVNVLFVDYGQTETVSLYDLRRISPQFLTLQGQAFRCSLLNPVDPTSAINDWTDEAIARFHSFVETAASSCVILKCTIYAVMYSEQKIVFNIVDLETPFESVCTSMVNLVKAAPAKKAAGPSCRLDTYYYSTHNVKTGTEEQVTVTCVNSVSQFYCHLERNTDVINDLKDKVSSLCHQLEHVKLPTVFGTLCFAKYTDGQWYRGQIKATMPAILVHFVDYGDTIEVEKSDLLPVPREANDIMSVPVQAVVCSLSDVPANVPNEVNSWFETSVTECKFRALIVAREPDGKLLVELYHGNTQVNAKIKKMFRIEMRTEQKVVNQGQRAHEASANPAQKTPKVVPKPAAEMEAHSQTINKNVPAPKPARQIKSAATNPQSAPKPSRYDCESGQKIRAAPLELYIPPHQRQSCDRTSSNTGNGSQLGVSARKESPPTEANQLQSRSPGAESEKRSSAEKFPQLADLPKSVTSDMEADVYVSHCNSPLSFYVQLVREEDELFSLVKKLNDPQSTSQTSAVRDLHPGDLVQAEFADDSLWYRAVVREVHSEMTALVEFVDFGNTAVMPISKVGRLQQSFLQLPMYSTHCMLSQAAGLGKEEVLDPEVVSAFKEDIGGCGEKVFRCRFIRQSGSVWEVSLEDSGVNVMCKVPARRSTDGSDIASEKLEQVEEVPAQSADIRTSPGSLLRYHHQQFSEGQRLEVYITAINDAQTFWCQLADSEELDKITSSVSEVGDAADHSPVDPGSLAPGGPCIALFSDDGFWYRAELLDKDANELSVLFVDYGNKSQVNITNVREMPPDLMDTPPQAFLCELDGFDASHGSWDSGAVDELSALTADRLLQLTVTRVTREEAKIKHLVQVECEDQVINEALKTWWKSSTVETGPGAAGPSYETPLQPDSAVKETAAPAEGQDIDTADSGPDEDRNDGEVALTRDGSPTKTTVKMVSREAVHPRASGDLPETHGNIPEDLKQIQTDLMLPSCVPAASALPADSDPAASETLTRTAPTQHSDGGSGQLSCSAEEVTCEEVTSTVEEVTCEEVISTVEEVTCDEVTSTVVEVTCEEVTSSAEEVTCEEVTSSAEEVTCEEVTSSVVEVTCEEVTSSVEEVTCEEVTSTVEEVTCEEVTSTVEEVTCDEVTTSAEEVTCEEVTSSVVEVTCEEVTSSVVEVTCEEATSTDEEVTSSVVEVNNEEVTSSSEELTSEEVTSSEEDVPSEEVTSTVEDVPSEEVTSTAEEVNNKEVTSSSEELTNEEVTSSGEEAPSEEVTSSGEEVPSEEAPSGEVPSEEAPSEEAPSWPALCSDPSDLRHDGKGTSTTDECVSRTTAEVQNAPLLLYREPPGEQLTEASELEIGAVSLQDEAEHYKNSSVDEDKTSALHQEQRFALPSDPEPQASTVPCPDLSDLVEEVTCLVREICLTGCRETDRSLPGGEPGRTDHPVVAADPQQEAGREEGEQQVQTPPGPEEDFSDTVLEEEKSSSADDSFEAQLSKITHLSLIISGGSADASAC